MKDKEIQIFILGIAINIVLVKILKKLLRLPRPISKSDATFGMPSTRAATLTFIIVYLILLYKPKQLTLFIMIATILFLCSLKYLMKEHSLLQLIIGSLIGLIIAYLLYKIQ